MSTVPCVPVPDRGEAKVGEVEVLQIHPSAARALIMQQSPNQARDVITQMELQGRARECASVCLSACINVHCVCVCVCLLSAAVSLVTVVSIIRFTYDGFKLPDTFDLLLCSSSSVEVCRERKTRLRLHSVQAAAVYLYKQTQADVGLYFRS